MYCSYQYLSIDPKNSTLTLTPQKAHKLQKIENLNVDISDIKDTELGFEV